VNEAKFSKVVCGIIVARGGQVSKVEAHASANGIPDLDYCLGGIEGHIELKVAREGKASTVRPSQRIWMRDRTNAGGTPFYLVLITDLNLVCFVSDVMHPRCQAQVSSRRWVEMAEYTVPQTELAESLAEYILTGEIETHLMRGMA